MVVPVAYTENRGNTIIGITFPLVRRQRDDAVKGFYIELCGVLSRIVLDSLSPLVPQIKAKGCKADDKYDGGQQDHVYIDRKTSAF